MTVKQFFKITGEVIGTLLGLVPFLIFFILGSIYAGAASGWQRATKP